MKVFVTGGAGYCGTTLVPDLLADGHEVTVLDTFWFGDFLPNNPKLKKIRGDFRNSELVRASIKNHDVVFHLAAIANDASFELDERLSTSINLDSFRPLVSVAKNSGVKHFVYASSSSVYGISDKPEVTEDHELVPLTLYNKYKGLCEPILFELTNNDFIGTVFRPATVCGYSPRQRLDLSVNILTNHAYNNHRIRVFGGNQKRPNLHVRDYSRACRTIMNSEYHLVQNQVFNVGGENLSINQLALIVQKEIAKFKNLSLEEIQIVQEHSDDLRSYHINSDKISRLLDFHPELNVTAAIQDLCQAFAIGTFENSMNNTLYFNVKRMKELQVE